MSRRALGEVKRTLSASMWLQVSAFALQARAWVLEARSFDFSRRYFRYPNQNEETTNELKMRITPSNFSGPPHLRRLLGKCFTKLDET